jgi:hypothetical protein
MKTTQLMHNVITNSLIRQIIRQTEGTITQDYLDCLYNFNVTQLKLILNYAEKNQLYCN